MTWQNWREYYRGRKRIASIRKNGVCFIIWHIDSWKIIWIMRFFVERQSPWSTRRISIHFCLLCNLSPMCLWNCLIATSSDVTWCRIVCIYNPPQFSVRLLKNIWTAKFQHILQSIHKLYLCCEDFCKNEKYFPSFFASNTNTSL